jgi:hypothetical protein
MLYWGDQQAGRTPCGFASPAALVLHGGGSIQKFGRITGAPYLGRRNQKAQQVTKKRQKSWTPLFDRLGSRV